MNISKQIDNFVHTLTIAAGEHKTVDQVGRYFILKSNTLTTDVEIAFGKSQHYTPWPVLWSFETRNQDEFFECVKFYNPSASAMTIGIVISTDWIDNKSAEVTGTITIPIDDASNGVTSDASIIVLPIAGILITAANPVNVGGGVVGIPLTSQPFVTGESVTITGCPQYNGAYTVLASSGVDQVNITATFKGGLIDNAAAVDKGGGKVGIPITGHTYTAGETITIANTTNYNGDFTVDATSTVNEVVITAAYVAETFDGVNDTHNLKFDGTDDRIKRSTPSSIPAGPNRKELHITNHDATYKVIWGDSDVDAANYRGTVIATESVYIITTTAQIYLDCEDGAGVAGCRVSWNHLTKT